MFEDALILSDIELVKLGDRFYSDEKLEAAYRCYTATLVSGCAYLQEHDFVSRLLFLDALQNKYPGEAIYYQRRGFCLLKMENLSDAIIDFERTVQIKPSSIKFRLNLGKVLVDAERYEEAKKGT